MAMGTHVCPRRGALRLYQCHVKCVSFLAQSGEMSIKPRNIDVVSTLPTRRRRRSRMQAPISSSSATATTLGNYQGGDTAARAVHPVLDAINESTKWTVSMAVFATLAVRRDLVCTLWVFGSIVAAIFCKIMKFAINEARPSTARKTDPGMPSSHANSLAFLSTFISLWAANSTSTFFSSSFFFFNHHFFLSGKNIDFIAILCNNPLSPHFCAFLCIGRNFATFWQSQHPTWPK